MNAAQGGAPMMTASGGNGLGGSIITVPTTTYKTQRALPRNVIPADFHRVRSSHQHLPLVLLLVLTQLSVGAFVTDLVLGGFEAQHALGVGRPYQSVVALLLGLLALGASVFHLGRPKYAFRAVLGIRTSWMSREALAFGLFAQAAVAYAAMRLGVSAKVVVFRTTTPTRIDLCKQYRAEVVVAETPAEAFDIVRRIEAEEGRFFIHPFNGYRTVLGTATLGYEWATQTPDLDAAAEAD